MKTKTISDYPLLMGELIRPRPMAQDPSPTLVDLFSKSIAQPKSTDSPLSAIDSECECSSSENARSPQRTKTLFSDRQEQAKGSVLFPFCNHKIFLSLSDE
jgi:hypothetical protein